jgi:hypothetical protein
MLRANLALSGLVSVHCSNKDYSSATVLSPLFWAISKVVSVAESFSKPANTT